jgi:hypothetical protein
MDCPVEKLDQMAESLLALPDSVLASNQYGIPLKTKIYYRILAALISKKQWTSPHIKRILKFFIERYFWDFDRILLEDSVGRCEEDLRAILGDIYFMVSQSGGVAVVRFCREIQKIALDLTSECHFQMSDIVSNTGISEEKLCVSLLGKDLDHPDDMT